MSCQGQSISTVTPSPEITVTPTLPAIVLEPTNPEAYTATFSLSSVILTCTAVDNFLLEFDYLPANIFIDSVDDPLNAVTKLTCAYRTPGHGVCSGIIAFGSPAVISLRICQGKDPLTRVCVSQAILPSQCPVIPTP